MDNQIRHLVYMMENAILNLPEGQEQMAWLVDFTGWSLSTSVPVKCARETINILQNHYPERLGVAFLYNPPRIFEAFWKVCFRSFPVFFLISDDFAKGCLGKLVLILNQALFHHVYLLLIHIV